MPRERGLQHDFIVLRGLGNMEQFYKPSGADIKLSEIHNWIVENYGGGNYALIINANDGEIVPKISVVLAKEVDSLDNLEMGNNQATKKMTGPTAMEPVEQK